MLLNPVRTAHAPDSPRPGQPTPRTAHAPDSPRPGQPTPRTAHAPDSSRHVPAPAPQRLCENGIPSVAASVGGEDAASSGAGDAGVIIAPARPVEFMRGAHSGASRNPALPSARTNAIIMRRCLMNRRIPGFSHALHGFRTNPGALRACSETSAPIGAAVVRTVSWPAQAGHPRLLSGAGRPSTTSVLYAAKTWTVHLRAHHDT